MGLTVSCEVLKFEVLYIYIYIYENTEYFNTHTGREDKVLKKQILVYFQKELTIRNYYWLICVAF